MSEFVVACSRVYALLSLIEVDAVKARAVIAASDSETETAAFFFYSFFHICAKIICFENTLTNP